MITPILTADDYAEIATMFAVKGKWEQSCHFYYAALALKPDNVDLLSAMAMAQREGGDIDTARGFICRALELDRKNAFAWNIYGKINESRGEFSLSGQAFGNAVGLMPENQHFHMNLAHLYQIKGEYEAAEKAYAEAIQLDPTNLEARFYHSMTLLTLGRLEEGYKEYELRYGVASGQVPQNGHTIWRGQESLEGKTILLCGEQGLGDVVMFARYGTWLKDMGAKKVIAISKKEILPVLRCVKGIDEVVETVEAAEPYDLHAPMMSMPGLAFSLGMPGELPSPYLEVEQNYEFIEPPTGKRIRIGYCWKGNPLHGNDKYRSIDQKLFERLKVKGAIAFSLQHGADSEVFADYGAETILEACQLIRELDLVVTVDTLIAHLAGAMGKPVWLLLSCNPDFRWGLGSESTPWYPSMRLYRANRPLQWGPVIERVRLDLETFVELRKAGAA